MNKQKLIVITMGQNCEKFLQMNMDSIKGADKIIYCDGGSHDSSVCIAKNAGADVIVNRWDKNDKAMNGKQRNFYLEFIKGNYPNDWCLVLDADELVEDLSKIKEFINDKERQPGIYNIKMRHLIDGLGWEDATRPVHVVPGRLFQIKEAGYYPEHSHPILTGELKGACLDTTIWHLGNCAIDYLDYVYNRFKQHMNDSLIHTSEFLEWWKEAHILNYYPRKRVNPYELPKQLLKRYDINPDKYYFQDRGLETKHFIDVYNYKIYFNLGEENGA
jgi:hypothetical protein